MEVFDTPEDALFEVEDDLSLPDETSVRRALAARYEFQRELGRGATGVVLAASDRRLRRAVAIKIVQAEAVAGVGTEQLLTELGHSAGLTHPNILPMLDAGVEAGHPYLVLPYVRGGSLRQRLEQGVRLPIDEALPLLEGVARALDHAHARQVLHCDVKPENVLVDDGHAYLMDFGIARRLHSEADEWAGMRRSIGYSAGTPAYVSPEQASGDAIDQRSDIYSLACVAYEMLSGRTPFEGTTTQEVVTRRFRSPAPPLRDTAPEVPDAVAEVIARAMALAPDRRPDSAMAFITELRTAAATRSRIATSASLAATRVLTRLRSRLGLSGPARLRIPFTGVMDDMRYTLRSLRRDWRFTANIIVSLGLGLGVGLPVLALSDHLFLRPPPGIAEPDRVLRLVKRQVGGSNVFLTPSVTATDYDAARRAQSLAKVAAYFPRNTSLGRGAEATPLRAMLITADFFEVLGTQPLVGRTFTAEEDVTGASTAPAILGHRYWQRELGGSADVIGRRLPIGAVEYQVIGIMPEGFNGVTLNEIDAYLPIHVAAVEFQGTDPRLWTTDNSAWIRVIARLGEGATPELTAAEATAAYLAGGPYARDKEHDDAMTWESIIPGRATVPSAQMRLSLWLSAGALLLNALIAANLVNLFVARAAARTRLTAIRIALGGGLRHLLRIQAVEALLLGLAGSAVGLLIAAQVAGVARATVLPAVSWTRPNVDLRLVGLALLMVLVTSGIAALASLAQARRTDPGELLRGSTSQRGGVGRGARTVRTAMLVVQAAVFAVLVSLSAAFVLSVRRAVAVDHGFEIKDLWFAEFPLSGAEYDEATRLRIYAEAAEAVRAVPGVEAVSQGYMVPWWNSASRVTKMSSSPESLPEALFDAASPEHLATTRMRLSRGRWIEPGDRAGAEPVVVVNETFARRAWPTLDALGQCVRVGADTMPCRTVVGVVGDARMNGEMDASIGPAYWVSVTQPLGGSQPLSLFIRMPGKAPPLEAIRAAIQGVEPRMLPVPVVPVTRNITWLTGRLETGRMVFTVFGTLAGLIAVVGLTGVLGYLVAQQRTSISLRLALGATPALVARPVVVRSVMMVGIGMLVGIVPLFLLRDVLDAMLFRTSIIDPTVIVPVFIVGLLMATAAALLPVREILRMEPMRVLREE